MILTVTLNPAIDITYHVDSWMAGQTHRVSRVDERLGGKGLNVASVLSQLDVPSLATGLLRDGPPSFASIAAPPRRTVVVADGRDATGFWEPGPLVSPDEWAAFQELYVRLLPSAKVVVLSGSLPRGLPDAAYGSLIGLARSFGAKTILDTSGPALRLGLAANPDIVKPNATELAELADLADLPSLASPDATSLPGADSGPVAAALPHTAVLPGAAAPPGSASSPHATSPPGADSLPGADLPHTAALPGAAASSPAADLPLTTRHTVVVASAGPAGLTAAGWRARPPRRIEGNPTGAGDACVAALARGLLLGTDWPSLLRDAVALSAAAVASPVAGFVDLDLYRKLLPDVIVEEI